MAAGYGNEEYADMHFMYGKANGNALQAARLYQEAFPARRQPDRRVFQRVHQRLRENGTFAPGLRAGRPRSITPAAEERVLQTVAQSPGTSTRRIAAQEPALSRSSVWRILHRHLLYPYHLQRVQALNDRDFGPRMEFCRWMQYQCALNNHFLSDILFTDEAGFTRDGIFNYHNCHVWSIENPHAIRESRHQQRFSLNVWVGLLGDRLLGPHILPNRLTGQLYLHFLQTVLPHLLEDVPLAQRQTMWFMHDGAPAHFARPVTQYLTEHFGQRWIGRGGPVLWPPRSPDLNPLDYCIWGHMKSLVYTAVVDTVDDLQHRVEGALEDIRNDPGLCERIRDSMHRRLRSCIQMHGRHFEHLL